MRKFISLCKSAYFWGRQFQIRLRELLFVKQPVDVKSIPIIINNFNRLTYLKCLIDRLERAGYTNIYIIDNASTYQPLLDYYVNTPYHVYRLNQNVGYLSLWQTGIYKQFRNHYFVYTDSDVVPDEMCPDDFLVHFYRLMRRYPRASKVGFSLRIDNLPDYFPHKEQVLQWESRFWQSPLPKEKAVPAYRAAIDTTFALYRPNVRGGAYYHDFMIRTGEPYTACHLPWYSNPESMSAEDKYYAEQAATSTHWTSITKTES